MITFVDKIKYFFMANFKFNVNTSGVIHLTSKLESISKSAFPAAVRSTLNDGAFEMKQKNILESAKRNMKVKQPNFFKANTGVERARFSRNIESMSATSGFINKRGQSANKAVTYGMEANEVGATDSTGLKYYPATRGGRGMVKRSQYWNKSKVDSDTTGNFIRKAFRSRKEKKLMMINTKNGRALIKVNSITKYKRANKSKGISKGSFKMNTSLLMMDRTVKKAKAKGTRFNREAAQKTQGQMEVFYEKNANFQFGKVWK